MGEYKKEVGQNGKVKVRIKLKRKRMRIKCYRKRKYGNDGRGKYSARIIWKQERKREY